MLSEPPWMPSELAAQAAHDDDDERPEQAIGEPALASRLAPGDHGRDEDARGEKGDRDPEDGELQVPRAHQVEGEGPGQVEAEEVDSSAR